MAKRRANGKGTLRQRSDGRWEGRVVVGYDEKGLPVNNTRTRQSNVGAIRTPTGRAKQRLPAIPKTNGMTFLTE